MNKIKQTMKKRIQPLLDLIYKANWKIEECEDSGYKIDIGWAGTSINEGCSTFEITIEEFTKNLAKTKGKKMTPLALQRILNKINKELEKLIEEEYVIVLTGCRPNGNVRLYLEDVKISLPCSEYEQSYFSESLEKYSKGR